ncbi:hypothetical protein [Alteribacillus sp. HJP-4]|uniref:hypothetical protein n=1 Tax=Alteribacillus sp. HJP-4 TaxID=2775394 RepID=UPI0035CCDBF6
MGKKEITVGLAASHGYPKSIVEDLQKELPELFSFYVNDECEWIVEYIVDPVTGITEKSEEVLESAGEKRQEKGWDFVICITDLPLLSGRKPIVAEASEGERAAAISLPGLGSIPMVKRIKESVLQLINEMYYGTSEKDREQAENRIQSKDEGEHKELRNKSSKKLVGNRVVERLSPIHREVPGTNTVENTIIDVRFFIKSRFSGALRMLTGMVRANRPWSMFPAFMKVIMIAFTTGSYALIFPTLWMLSTDYGLWRMAMLTVISISAMVAWIILAHSLWEKTMEDRSNYLRKLYNIATVLTLFFTVCLYYLLLFFLFSVAVIVLIPTGMLESQLSKPPQFMDYFNIAWTATSISTIIGALGSALEKENVVLSATYGYRQRQRYELMKNENSNTENEEGFQ